MKTRSIDLAAYLHLCGIEPADFTLDERFKVREFEYTRTPDLQRAVEAFDRGAMVPAKAYAEARAAMKSLSKRNGQPIKNQLRAFERARGQIRGGQ